MTKLMNDTQLKASYTQKELVDLIERKASIAQRALPVGYKRFNKSALIAEVRYLDNVIWNADDDKEDFIEDDGIIEGVALVDCTQLVANLIEAEVNLTDDILEAIWLLGDGTMISGDFDCGSRGTDHRIIEAGVADFDRYDGQAFWNHVHEAYDAIRLVPEAMLALVKVNQHVQPEHKALVEAHGYRMEEY